MCALWDCPDGRWRCANNLCIDDYDVCDNVNENVTGALQHILRNTHSDCLDHSEESWELCSTWQCLAGTWKCANSKCINERSVCDGIDTCHDGSDELDTLCSSWQCFEDQWKCGSYECIDLQHVCNGYAQCTDLSDEDPVFCNKWNCTQGL